MPDCLSCQWSMTRYDSDPNRNWNYEACELGLTAMVPEITTDHVECDGYRYGKEKTGRGINLIYGEDIEL